MHYARAELFFFKKKMNQTIYHIYFRTIQLDSLPYYFLLNGTAQVEQEIILESSPYIFYIDALH